MAIGPERRQYMERTLQKSIAAFYGDSVPTLDAFKNKRRKTFMEKLEEVVDAAGWRQKIAEAKAALGSARGVVTTLEGNRQARMAELRAKQEQELAELKAKHQAQQTALVAHYEPNINQAVQKRRELEEALTALLRQSYFAGIDAEDDNRYLGSGSSIEEAIKQRVDAFIGENLMSDTGGEAVMIRMKQEAMIGDIAYIAENMKDLREKILAFIAAGKLPTLTVEAWGIENGKDIWE